MIDVTIKTLDGQNHRFSVPDEITIKDFKDRIANSVSVTSDKQRLIYCGRVLQDDKPLSHYNVHEKVIHLVARAPPPEGGNASNNGANASQDGPAAPETRPRRMRVRTRHTGSDGAMIFGPFVMPDDGDIVPTQGPSSSGMRLHHARSLLERAGGLLDQLERRQQEATGTSSVLDESTQRANGAEPKPPANTVTTTGSGAATATGENSNSGSTTAPMLTLRDELETFFTEMDAINSINPSNMRGSSASMNIPLIGSLSGNLPPSQMFAMASAVAASMGQGANGAVPSAMGLFGAPPTAGSSQTQTAGTAASTTGAESWGLFGPPSEENGHTGFHLSPPEGSSTNTTAPSESLFGTATSSENFFGTAVPRNNNNNNNTTNMAAECSTASAPAAGNNDATPPPAGEVRLEHPRCASLVEVVDQYQALNRRLEPFLTRYRDVLAADATYAADDPALLQDQYLALRVSEALHFLSHTLHAVSDIMVDLRQPPPRQLRAQPVVIHQPAIVQAQINVTASTEPRSRSASMTRSASQPRPTPNPSTTQPNTANPPSNGSIPPTSTAGSGGATGAANSEGVNMRMMDDNVFLMEIGPDGMNFQSHSSNSGNSGNGTSATQGQGSPMDFIRNILSSNFAQFGQASQMMPQFATMQASATTTSGTTTNASVGATSVHPSRPTSTGTQQPPQAVPGSSAPQPPNSTAPGTQTGAAQRPHMHVTPLSVPGMGMNQFDLFLPCQSHFVHSPSRRRHNAQMQMTMPSGIRVSRGRMPLMRMPQPQQQQQPPPTVAAGQPPMPSTSTMAQTPTGITPQVGVSPSDAFDPMSLFTNIMMGPQSGSGQAASAENMLGQMMQMITSQIGSTMSAGNAQSGRERSLQDWLQPYLNIFGLEEVEDEDSLFHQLFTIVVRTLSLGDVTQLMSGNFATLNQLQVPFREFANERLLRGENATPENRNRAIEVMISDMGPILETAAIDGNVREGVDFRLTIENFLRQRLGYVLDVILCHNQMETYGKELMTVVREMITGMVALMLDCYTDGAAGLERMLEQQVRSVTSGNMQGLSVQASLMQLRTLMANMDVSSMCIRRYVVAAQREVSPPLQVVPPPVQGLSPQVLLVTPPNIPVDEVMEVEDVAGTEEVETSGEEEHVEGAAGGGATMAMEGEEEPISVNVGAEPWHSAVPSEWLPVITRDIERQRRIVPETRLSDAYLCGMPVKRRKLANQNAASNAQAQDAVGGVHPSARAQGATVSHSSHQDKRSSDNGNLAD